MRYIKLVTIASLAGVIVEGFLYPLKLTSLPTTSRKISQTKPETCIPTDSFRQHINDSLVIHVASAIQTSTPDNSESSVTDIDIQSKLKDEVQAKDQDSDSLKAYKGTTNSNTALMTEKVDLKALIRKEGGLFSIRTKFGGLNLFSVWYGVVAITLGIPWYIALTLYQLMQFLTGGRFDKNRLLPILINHLWGVSLMTLTRCFPKMENREILREFYRQKRCAMFVANHNSWMDIPFLGATIGWRNYKLISKKELGAVPILGKAIKVAGNLMVDRSDRKSGLKTLKRGIQYLKDGVHLCTFPEGTRTRNGRLMPFKNGAFKMAHKAGAPVIPISIVGADSVMPVHWMFPYRPAHKFCKVIVHEPIESTGITEAELANRVREAMISGLPESQRPN